MGDVDQLGPDDLMSFDACALEGPIFLCFCGFQMVDVECRLADLWHVINSEPRKYIGYPYQGLKNITVDDNQGQEIKSSHRTGLEPDGLFGTGILQLWQKLRPQMRAKEGNPASRSSSLLK